MFKEIVEKIKNFDIKPKPPKSLGELNSKARLLVRRGLYTEASRIYKKLVLLFPDNSECLDNYLAYHAFDSVSSALDISKKLLEKYPNDISLLSCVAISTSDREEAMEYHSRILEMSPNVESSKYFVKVLTGRAPKKAPIAYVKSLFDSYANYFDHHLEHCLGYETPAVMADILKKQHSKKIPFNNVLDACCGTGLFGKQLRINFKIKNLVGVDISTTMIDQAKKKHLYNELHELEIHKFLQGKVEQYDLISFVDAFVYIGDLEETFSLAHKAITTGGLLCFTTEISKKEDFVASDSGRYLHHRRYIKALAKNRFTVMKFRKEYSRKEAGHKEFCYYVILMKI